MPIITEIFHPSIVWCQDTENIFLSVKLSDAKETSFKAKSTSISFEATGVGANGLREYAFDLELYKPILDQEVKLTVCDQNIRLSIPKETAQTWPRLTNTTDRLPWLRTDFSRLSDSVLDEMLDECVHLDGDAKGNEPNVSIEVVQPSAEERKKHNEDLLYANMQDEWSEFVALIRNPIVLYLLIYNLFQFAGFLYVFGTLLTHFWKEGSGAKSKAFLSVADRLFLVLLASFLEIAHVLLGWVKSGLVTTFLQVFGRNLIFFAILIPHKELQEEPVVFTLFIAWSLIELVRYPYYLLRVFNEEIGFITYLRYTLWIPLYPIGFMCEGKLILLSLPLLEQSKRFSIQMPNFANISFDFSMFLQAYFLITLPCFALLMHYMYRQRKAKLGVVLPSSRSLPCPRG